MASVQNESKAMVSHIEKDDIELNLKQDGVAGVVDYAGASAKVDPVEIALVRKLDIRIMPTLWAMYFMNYVSY